MPGAGCGILGTAVAKVAMHVHKWKFEKASFGFRGP